MAKRVAVTARGIALLALIAASKEPAEGVMMLTQDEGAEAVAAGYATVDATKTEGNTAAVSLTDAGRAALTAGESTTTGAAAAAGYAIDADIPMPGPAARRGRAGGYPFEALEIGQSFHVAPGKDDTLDTLLTRLSSSVSGARAKFAEPTGEKEEVTVKTFKKGDDGKYLKDDAGKRIVESEAKETRDKTRLTRDFFAAKVDGTDPKGEGVRIWRVALQG